jgi:hypothetical protein
MLLQPEVWRDKQNFKSTGDVIHKKRNRTNEDGTFLKHNKGTVNVDDAAGQ